MQPQPDLRFRALLDRHTDLLLTMVPFLNILRGERRENLHRAFVNGALFIGSNAMDIDEGRLPTTAREAALELHRAALDLAQRAGVSRVELTEDYNAHGEAGTFAPGGMKDAADRCLALIAVFHARALLEPQS